ncbi:MAG: lysogenization protein HflD [bacterium]
MTNRAIALAGIFQAIQLVDQIAFGKQANLDDLRTSLDSIFIFNPEQAIDIYGSVHNVSPGIRAAIAHLEGDNEAYQFRYALNLIYLQSKLGKDSNKLDMIGHKIKWLDQQGYDHDSMDCIEGLAEIYSQFISKIKPAIMVRGNPGTLQQPMMVARVRALLLAGIRASSLWNSANTGKFTLLFSRKKLIQELKNL